MVNPRLAVEEGRAIDEEDNRKAMYHAFSQTDQIRKVHPMKNHRSTQTYKMTTKSGVTHKEFGTQMERAGLWIDTRTDVVKIAQPYFTSEMWMKRREEAAHFIQKMMRGCFARKKTRALKEDKRKKKEEQIRLEKEFREKEEHKHEREIRRRINPKTREDFDTLYQELELWRANEMAKIKGNKDLTAEQKKAAMKQLLEKETELLQTIDRLKIEANKQNREEKIQNFLKAMSDPKRWHLNSDGRYVQVTTPNIMRARELMEIYNGLKDNHLSLEERLTVLLNIKITVYDHLLKLQSSRGNPRLIELDEEILDLIKREANLLNRGRPEKSLGGLRVRLANLFLQFIESPENNPEASEYMKMPVKALQHDLELAKTHQASLDKSRAAALE